MICRFYHIVGLVALVLPHIAHAEAAHETGWDRVAWGMTKSEIAALYGQRARVLEPPIEFGDSEAAVVLPDAELAGLNFRAYFQTDKRSHRLIHVLLERRRQQANPKIWNSVVAALKAELGAPSEACNAVGKRGRPTVIKGLWRPPGSTVEASYLDFAAPVLRYSLQSYFAPDGILEAQPFYRNLYPARRILVRYSPEGRPWAGCGQR